MTANRVTVIIEAVDRLSSTLGGISTRLQSIGGIASNVSGVVGSGLGMAFNLVADNIQGVVDAMDDADTKLQSTIALAGQLSGLLGIGYEEATNYVAGLNREFTELAARLPGATEDYKQLGTAILDSLISANTIGDKTNLDLVNEQIVSITESLGLLRQSADIPVNNVQSFFAKFIEGASQSRLETLLLAQQMPALMAMLDRAVVEVTGKAQDYEDLTKAERARVFEIATRSLVPPEAVSDLERTASAQIEAIKTRLFDANTGVFGLLRDVLTDVEGNQTVMNAVGNLMGSVFGKGGVLDQFGLLLKRIGIEGFDPLLQLYNGINALTNWIDSVAQFLGGLELPKFQESGLFDSGDNFLQSLTNATVDLFKGLQQRLRFSKIYDKLAAVMASLDNVSFKGIGLLVGKFVAGLGNTVVAGVRGLLDNVFTMDAMENVGRLIGEALNEGMIAVLSFFNNADWFGAGANGASIFFRVGDAIRGAIKALGIGIIFLLKFKAIVLRKIAIGALKMALGFVGQALKESFIRIPKSIGFELLRGFVSIFTAPLKLAGESLANLGGGLFNLVRNGLVGLGGLVTNVVSGLFNFIATPFRALAGLWSNSVKALWGGALNIARIVGRAVKAVFDKIKSLLFFWRRESENDAQTTKPKFNIRKLVLGIVGAIQRAVFGFFSPITNAIDGVVKGYFGLVKAGFNLWKRASSFVFGGIQSKVFSLAGSTAGFIKSGLTNYFKLLRGVFKRLTSFITSPFKSIREASKGLGNAVRKLGSRIKGLFSRLGRRIKGFFGKGKDGKKKSIDKDKKSKGEDLKTKDDKKDSKLSLKSTIAKSIIKLIDTIKQVFNKLNNNLSNSKNNNQNKQKQSVSEILPQFFNNKIAEQKQNTATKNKPSTVNNTTSNVTLNTESKENEEKETVDVKVKGAGNGKVNNAASGQNVAEIFTAINREIDASPSGSDLTIANSSETILNKTQSNQLVNKVGSALSKNTADIIVNKVDDIGGGTNTVTDVSHEVEASSYTLSAISRVSQALGDVINDFKISIDNTIARIPAGIDTISDAVTSRYNKTVNTIQSITSLVKNTVTDSVVKARDSVVRMADDVKSTFTNLPAYARSTGIFLKDSVVNKINQARSFFSSIPSRVSSSASRAMDNIVNKTRSIATSIDRSVGSSILRFGRFIGLLKEEEEKPKTSQPPLQQTPAERSKDTKILEQNATEVDFSKVNSSSDGLNANQVENKPRTIASMFQQLRAELNKAENRANQPQKITVETKQPSDESKIPRGGGATVKLPDFLVQQKPKSTGDINLEDVKAKTANVDLKTEVSTVKVTSNNNQSTSDSTSKTNREKNNTPTSDKGNNSLSSGRDTETQSGSVVRDVEVSEDKTDKTDKIDDKINRAVEAITIESTKKPTPYDFTEVDKPAIPPETGEKLGRIAQRVGEFSRKVEGIDEKMRGADEPSNFIIDSVSSTSITEEGTFGDSDMTSTLPDWYTGEQKSSAWEELLEFGKGELTRIGGSSNGNIVDSIQNNYGSDLLGGLFTQQGKINGIAGQVDISNNTSSNDNSLLNQILGSNPKQLLNTIVNSAKSILTQFTDTSKILNLDNTFDSIVSGSINTSFPESINGRKVSNIDEITNNTIASQSGNSSSGGTFAPVINITLGGSTGQVGNLEAQNIADSILSVLEDKWREYKQKQLAM